MQQDIFLQEKPSSFRLFVCHFGEEECHSAHSFGPHVRDHFLIHFVASGCGVFRQGGREHIVRAGQGFLIFPGEETFYQADDEDPWHYAWVGYRGNDAQSLTCMAGLDDSHRVFTSAAPEQAWQALADMRREAQMQRLDQISALGNLLRFMSFIAPVQDPIGHASAARQICDKAMWYLEGRCDQNVSIQETADYVRLSRSQLYRVMMAEYGCSPKELLLRIRMRRTEHLLLTTTLTLDDIASRVGLITGTQLGVVFRKVYGVTPGSFRTHKGKMP